MLLVDAARIGVLADGEVGGLADDFAHHTDGTHHAHGAEGFVGDGDVAAGEEEVVDVLGVEQAVRQGVAVTTVDGGSDVLPVGIDIAESRTRDEGVLGELLGELLVGVVEVDVPGRRHAAVREVGALDDVVLVENDVSVEEARFARAADVRGPLELRHGVLILLRAVLEGGEGAVHGAEIPVADVFQVLDRILVEAGFPEPLGLHEGLVVDLGLGLLEEREVAHLEGQRPRGGGPRRGLVYVLVEPHVGHAHALVGFGTEGRAGVGAHPAMAGGVGHELGAEEFFAARLDVDGLHGGDAVAVHDHAGGEVAEEEADVLLLADDLLLEFVAEAVDAAGAVRRTVTDLLDHLAEVRVFAAGGAAHGPDADFGAAVAAEDKTVLDESDLEGLTGSGERRAEAAVAAADDDEVELALVFGALGAVPLRAGRDERVAFGRSEGGVLAEEDGVGASVETGEVMQRDLHFAGGQGDLTAFLPMPLGALRAELGGDRLAVDDQLEAAGGAGGVPVRDPILGADPDAVFARGGDTDGAGRVRDGLTEAVGQEVGRADDVGESRVELPAALGGQGFGFDEDRIGGLSAAGQGSQQGQSKEGEDARGHGMIRCQGGEGVPDRIGCGLNKG